MNPLLPMMNQNTLQTAKNLYQNIKNAPNPIAAMQLAAQNNPALRNVLNQAQGRNPQQMFYEECQRRGVDPNYVLSYMK